MILLFYNNNVGGDKVKLYLLREIREEKKYSQEDVARGINISLRSYVRKEKGEREFSISEFERLITFLDIDANTLLEK